MCASRIATDQEIMSLQKKSAYINPDDIDQIIQKHNNILDQIQSEKEKTEMIKIENDELRKLLDLKVINQQANIKEIIDLKMKK